MEKQIILGFTGDIMCDNLETMNNNNFDNFISDTVSRKLKSVDYCIGNLETPIIYDTNKSNERYSFCAPDKFAINLKKYGFNLFSTANNHCLDCGIKGLIENCEILESLNIDYVGTNKTNSNRVFIKEIDGVKIAFLSYTYGTNAFLNHCYLDDTNFYYVNLSRKQELSNKLYRRIKNKFFENLYIFNPIRDKKYLNRVREDLNFAKKNADITIFLLHTGGQYNKKAEHYTLKLCDYIKKNGADVIIGNHPHVVLNHKKNIYYSLGNFYATPYSNHNQVDDIPNYSIFLKLVIDKESKKIVRNDTDIFKTVIINDYPVTFDVNELYDNQTKIESKIIQENFNRK